MNLHLESDRNASVVRVACAGQITASNLNPDDMDPLEGILGLDGFSSKVLLDLDKTTFIDSSGISWLISRHNEFNENGGVLVLHSVPPVVQQVFDLLRLGAVLNLASDQEAAETRAVGGTS
ncbi:MAG: STAS domain-containing protein [Phycisphaerae bacterium]|nr:STAS domain-containing protein [Phycisphaerae bacterium]